MISNIVTDLPTDIPEELVETLLDAKRIRVERIVSHGHASPNGSWYNQDENEWVVVLKGRAKLLFEEDAKPMVMGPGDFVNIPAHKRHRVEWTAADEPTVWLAVFYGGE